jgi:MYXO-CTERM domain-containing protein
MKRLSFALAGVLAFPLAASAAVYPGNGNSGFGGPVGLGSLSLSDDGTTLNGTFTKGTNGVNDNLVIYVDSVSGGFTDTSSFSDANDGLRKSISGFDGGTNRSLLTMPAGFLPDYAIALGPAAESFGGLWQLASGGNNSLPFISSVNLNPVGTSTSPTYTFSLPLSSIGITPGNKSFTMLGTYISNSGFRSDEFIAGNGTGTQGWNPFVGTTAAQYTSTVTPEPASFGLLAIGALVGLRRRRI